MLTDGQVDRFSRQILLREVGGSGQEELLAACVRVERLDEAGRALALWLARSGIGALSLPPDRSPAPARDAAGLLLASDAGRPLVDAVRERLSFHAPDLAFRSAWTVESDGIPGGPEGALALVRRILRA